MARRIYIDSSAIVAVLNAPHHCRDLAQLTLFEDEITETVDGCAPAGTGQNRIEFARRMEAMHVTKIVFTHPDEDHQVVARLKEQTAAQRELALTEAIEGAVEQLGQPPLPPIAPPVNAQFFLDLFMPESRCEEFLGDLQERYSRKLTRLGKARADWWYRKQVATSLWPLFRAFLGRTLKGSLGSVVCLALRLVGQVSWADALRKAVDEERRRSI